MNYHDVFTDYIYQRNSVNTKVSCWCVSPAPRTRVRPSPRSRSSPWRRSCTGCCSTPCAPSPMLQPARPQPRRSVRSGPKLQQNYHSWWKGRWFYSKFINFIVQLINTRCHCFLRAEFSETVNQKAYRIKKCTCTFRIREDSQRATECRLDLFQFLSPQARDNLRVTDTAWSHWSFD